MVRRFGHHEETSDEYHGYNAAEYGKRQIRHERSDAVRIQETEADEQLQEGS